ncbi:MAG: YtxH domain-containing protein [Acidobacteriota bacterium]
MANDSSGGAGTVMLAFLVGAVTGAAVALLFAPASGEETREYLGTKAREGRERARQAVEQGREAYKRQSEAVSQAVERGREAFQQARERGEGQA